MDIYIYMYTHVHIYLYIHTCTYLTRDSIDGPASGDATQDVGANVAAAHQVSDPGFPLSLKLTEAPLLLETFLSRLLSR